MSQKYKPFYRNRKLLTTYTDNRDYTAAQWPVILSEVRYLLKHASHYSQIRLISGHILVHIIGSFNDYAQKVTKYSV